MESGVEAEVLRHNFAARYARPPPADGGGGGTLRWLEAFCRDACRLLGAGERAGGSAAAALRTLRERTDRDKEEVEARAGEMVGMSEYVSGLERRHSEDLQRTRSEASLLEARAGGAADALKESRAQLAVARAAARAAEDACAREEKAADALRATVARLEHEAAAAAAAAAAKEAPPPPLLVAEETEEVGVGEGEGEGGVRQQEQQPLLPADAAAAAAAAAAEEAGKQLREQLERSRRTEATLNQEVALLRSRFGRVDSVVEDLKAELPRRCVPSAFHRCGPDDTRWVFGTRTIVVHAAGETDAVATVGGGCLSLRDFVLRAGEQEVWRERHAKRTSLASAAGARKLSRRARAASLQ